MDKLKVYLVYTSFLDSCEGLGGGGAWNKPELVGAFRVKKDARNWARQQRKKFKFDWRQKFSYKTLLVT
jgi:hypothetical protein